MAGFTERSAFLQFFQIIMVGIALGLEIFAYYIDAHWNAFVGEHKIVRTCAFLTKEVDGLDGAYKKSIEMTINEASAWKGDKVRELEKKDDHDRQDKQFLEDNIRRFSVGEKTAMILLLITLVLLVFHLFLACCSSNYEYRTKWAAATQGTVMFLTGFAAIFLAISAHGYDAVYEELSDKFLECKILSACSDAFTEQQFKEFLKKNGFTPKSLEDVLQTLNKYATCQEFDMKIGASIMCGVIVIICFLIICHAMELTTIYDEEDVDEEERARRQAFHNQALHAKRKMHKKHGTRASSAHHLNDDHSGTSSARALAEAERPRRKSPALQLLHNAVDKIFHHNQNSNQPPPQVIQVQVVPSSTNKEKETGPKKV